MKWVNLEMDAHACSQAQGGDAGHHQGCHQQRLSLRAWTNPQGDVDAGFGGDSGRER